MRGPPRPPSPLPGITAARWRGARPGRRPRPGRRAPAPVRRRRTGTGARLPGRGRRPGLAPRHRAAVIPGRGPGGRGGPRIYVSAGEPSGDAHAAAVVTALRRRLPDATFEAFGGPGLEAAGAIVL